MPTDRSSSSREVRVVSSYGLEVLERDECVRLLLSQRVGRVGVCEGGPLVVPVVFGMLDGDIVFRTAPGEKLVAAALHRPLAFEVDEYDLDRGTGWSVLVVGPAEEMVHPDDLRRAEALGLPAWAGEARDRFVHLEAEQVSGRRLRPAPSG
jgi:nitroimidazol reductase NimA-like FMN-containing flavoprotein (pyridoxamine 5'-phosphate oxidase superfamily)